MKKISLLLLFSGFFCMNAQPNALVGRGNTDDDLIHAVNDIDKQLNIDFVIML